MKHTYLLILSVLLVACGAVVLVVASLRQPGTPLPTLSANTITVPSGTTTPISYPGGTYLPDAILTPGAANPDITQATIAQTICNPHWSTKSVRPPSSYTSALKVKQIAEYGYTDTKPADYEEDHLISLELGGSPTDPNNLWPEPYTIPAPDGNLAGAHQKDRVENYLHAQVCAGTLTLARAQVLIAGDWYTVYAASGLK